MVGLCLVACGTVPDPAPASSVGGERRGWHRLELVFVPPLAAPGELQVLHESGHEQRQRTGVTGVGLLLPEGPALLRLSADGATFELPISIGAAATIEWRR